MDKDHDYIRDISEIRTMMERSSKFQSLSGLAGIIVGIYALIGAYIAYAFFRFRPEEMNTDGRGTTASDIFPVMVLATIVLVASVATAILLSYKRARSREEGTWNATSRRLMMNMAVPLVAGGILLLVFVSRGLISFLAPFTLIFYGLALYNAGNYTFKEVKYLGMIQVILGLAGTCLPAYGLLIWSLGFGVMNIVYGIYIHIKHER